MSDIQLVLDGVPEEPAADPVQEQENALAAQKVLSEVEKLSAEEQAQVEAFAKKIDLHKSEIITNYGATIQKQSAAIATKTLQDVKTKNTGEISIPAARITDNVTIIANAQIITYHIYYTYENADGDTIDTEEHVAFPAGTVI